MANTDDRSPFGTGVALLCPAGVFLRRFQRDGFRRRRALPQAHFGYMESGVDDDLTLRANREGCHHIELRTRRLIEVSKVDRRVEIFGATFDFPVFICPTRARRMSHPDAELATGCAAKAKGALQILSTVTSVSYEDIARAGGGPVWYQLYAPPKWEQAGHIIQRVEAAGCPALALTVDLLGGRNTETRDQPAQALHPCVRAPTGFTSD